MPTAPHDPAQVAEDLRSVVALLVRRLRADYTVPTHQLGALRALDSGGPRTASGLAALEHVRPQSMAHTLQQLEQLGFVTKHRDPADGRQMLVDLSDAGRAALDAQRRETAGWLTTAIDGHLDLDEQARLADAVSLLRRLVEG